MRTKLALLCLVPLLAGCISPEAEKAKALDEAKTRCESQGKQLHVVTMKQEGLANVTQYHTTIDFECLGPGDPGYVAPPAH